MPSWVLWLPFAAGCVAWVVTFVILWATQTPGPAPSLGKAAILANFWICYVMLVLSMILERRHFGLRSLPARLWAYRLVLFANASMPIILTLALTEEYLGTPPWPPPPPLGVVHFLLLGVYAAGLLLLLPLFVAGLLFPVVSWAIVTFFCLFKDRSSKVPGRVLPAAFAIPGSIAHCFLVFAYSMSI